MSDKPASAPLLVVQLTDTHLFADPSHRSKGINTRESFNAVLELASDDLLKAGQILITGDISHDELLDSYRFIEKQLQLFPGPKTFLPGNHDDLALLAEVTSSSSWPTVDKHEAWLIIGLNTQLTGHTHGYLEQGQLQALAELLANHADRHILIALHHPPICINSEWMDNIGLHNQAEFRSIVSENPQVKAVIFGHAHQELDEVSDGVRCLCCPSTCMQFMPGTREALRDERLPGYRWLKLFEDGSLETGIRRLQEWPPGNEVVSGPL